MGMGPEISLRTHMDLCTRILPLYVGQLTHVIVRKMGSLRYLDNKLKKTKKTKNPAEAKSDVGNATILQAADLALFT